MTVRTAPDGTWRGKGYLRWRNLAAIAAGGVLLAYVSYLLILNYRAAMDLQRNLLRQIRQKNEIQALTFEFLFTEAVGHARNLANSREIEVYFKNLDLGMSMEYGLRQSIVPIRERFSALVAREFTGGGARMFARILLLDRGGRPLADSGGGDLPWKEYLDPLRTEPSVIVSPDGKAAYVSCPYLFKGRYEGQLLLWLTPETLRLPLAKLAGSENEGRWLVSPGPTPVYTPLGAGSIPPPSLVPVLADLKEGDTRIFERGEDNGKTVSLVASRVAIHGTPYSLVHVSEAARAFGAVAPGRHLIGLAMAALGILLGTAAILAFNLRDHIFQVRLDELAIREREVARKNEELRKEIEERKAAQEASARLGMAVEQVGETIVITDTEGVIQYVNPAFEKSSGYRREEALGRKPGILKSGKHGPEYYRELWDTLRRGETWSGEFVNRRKDGALYEEIAVISPLRDGSGTTVNYVAVKRELTNEIRLKEQLRQAQKMEAIGTLAGGIAHDFNNLLTAIMGYSELILQRLGPEDPVRTEVEEIRKAGERAASLTRQLLAFSRRQILSPRIVDLNAIVTGMEKMLQRVIREDIELTATLGERLWKARVDPGQMEQVLMNLVVNARDAMPRGGALSIRTENAAFPEGSVKEYPGILPGEYVKLAVDDTGSGMDGVTLSRIFEPFFTTKEQGKGTGLGLSTVYGIVKQSQGYIFVNSEPGKGSRFEVFLPRAGESPGEDADKPAAAAVGKPGGNELVVLVVEDDPLVGKLAHSILRADGYTVLEAKDGVEALAVSDSYRGRIHLMITDVVMPNMGGVEVARRILAARPGLKIIFMSGYAADTFLRGKVFEEGHDFLPKPFGAETLALKVRDTFEAAGLL